MSPTRIIHPGDGPLIAGIWVHGTDLRLQGAPSPLATLTLRRIGWPDTTSDSNSSYGQATSGSLFFREFDLAGAPLGFYDVILTRSDGQTATVVDGFEIVVDPGLKIRQIGAWGGAVNGVEVDPATNLAYVGSGVRLLIFDVNDPTTPVELGSVMTEGVIGGVAVRDGYAYLASTPPAYLSVVDVSDPAAPQLVSTGNAWNPGTDQAFHDVRLHGNMAFALFRDSTASCFDISDPTAPVPIGACVSPTWSYGGSDLLFDADFGFQAASNIFFGQVSIFDTTDPAEPFPPLLGFVDIPEMGTTHSSLTGIARHGDYVYATAKFVPSGGDIHSLIFVVDFSDPTAPVHVGTWGDPTGESFGFGDAIDVADGRLYWAGSGPNDSLGRSMAILDIATDPANPTLIGALVSVARFAEIEVVGTTAYLGDSREGFTIVDCSDPAKPVRLSNYHSPSVLRQAALDSGLLYVTSHTYGLSVLDVSDPREPTLTGKFETGDEQLFSWGIAVRDDLAYVAAGRAGLQVVDVSDPAVPTLAGEFLAWPDGARSYGLTLSPDEPIIHLGVRTSSGGAFVVNFDVSDLANIIDVGDVFIGSGYPLTIARRADGIAYVPYNAVATVDLSVPESPTLLGTTGPGNAIDAALAGDVLYATGGNSLNPQRAGLRISSVATPDGLPLELAHFGSGSGGTLWSYAVATSGGRTYVDMNDNLLGPSLGVIDSTDPTSPVLIASAPSAAARIDDLLIDGPYVHALARTVGSVAGGAGVLSYLVYIPGDYDANGVIDEQDADFFANCFTGPGVEPPDATCLIFDFDDDNDVDCDDWEAFKLAWSGPGGPDKGDPPNFVPCDGSPPCPADLDGDGNVTAADLAQLLGSWGPCDGICPADLDADRDVDAADLAQLLGSWGACE